MDHATIADRIVDVIIERLALEDLTRETFPRDAVLFAPPEGGGLGFDSIASLEIVSGLSDAFDLPFDDIRRDDFTSVTSLARYVGARLGVPAA